MNLFERIAAEKIFAVLRIQDTKKTKDIIKALYDGGIKIVEIVIETPEMVKAVEEIANQDDNKPLIMAGGIITQRQADIAINAGSSVIVSPILQMNLVKFCQNRKTPLIMTATTPNEAYTAWKSRTKLIKISPANPMGGAEYIEDLLRPMKFLNVIAAGSIKLNDISSYLRAGVKAVGIGRDFYADANYAQITKRAQYACEQAGR